MSSKHITTGSMRAIRNEKDARKARRQEARQRELDERAVQIEAAKVAGGMTDWIRAIVQRNPDQALTEADEVIKEQRADQSSLIARLLRRILGS